MNQLKHDLAEYAHDAWCVWMNHLLNECVTTASGETVITAESLERWIRQMQTDYDDLPAIEQRSDVEQANRILEILGDHVFVLLNG